MRDVDRDDINNIGKARDVFAWLRERNLEAEDVVQLVARDGIGAMTSVWLLDVLDADVADRVAASVAERLVELLGSLPGRARLECAEQAKLPLSVRRFGDQAAPILRLLIEDETLRPFFADRAARLWLELDMHDAALPAALGIADEVTSMTLLNLAARVERDEAYEFLSQRFERDDFFCELLSRSKLVRGDDRWVALAMSRLHRDPKNAVRLLTQVGGERMEEELVGIIVHADAPDDAFRAALAAVGSLPKARAVEALASVLQLPFAATLANDWEARMPFVNHRDELEHVVTLLDPVRDVLDAMLSGAQPTLRFRPHDVADDDPTIDDTSLLSS